MTKGEKIISDIHDRKKELNNEKNHERNLKCKVVALTLLCVAVVEGAFILGTLVK